MIIMTSLAETTESTGIDKRSKDPYMDRRSGDDRRQVYSIDYFANNGLERRQSIDRRSQEERRDDCVSISKWTSVCASEDDTQ
jgi:hypothetical protein